MTTLVAPSGRGRPSLAPASQPGGSDAASSTARADVVQSSSGQTAFSFLEPRLCLWCRRPLEVDAPPEQAYHDQKCRQAAWRLRCRRQTDARNAQPMRMGYADPPYLGLAKRYYGDQPTYAGEVDHVALIESLKYSYDGWALSCSERSLRTLLPLCPERARVCPWCKPIGACPNTFGLHSTWEPLIVVPGRELQPGIRDWLLAQPARFEGDLVGRKPSTFIAFLFDALGLLPGDEFVDLFPGTGIVGRAWAMLSSLRYRRDASSPGDDADAPSVVEVLDDWLSRQAKLPFAVGCP